MLGASVAVPGPPAVRMKMVSNTLKASMRRSSTITAISGASSGRVMRRKACMGVAPSTAAAR